MVVAKKRTGLPSLAYTGVEAPTPPNLTINTRPPTDSDNLNFRIGDLWLEYQPGFPNIGTFEDFWVLVGLERGVAHWVHAIGGGAGGILFEEGDVGGQISPDGTDTLFHLGWANINTFGTPASNSISYNLNEVIRWSATNNTGTTGVIYLNGDGSTGTGGTRFMHGIENGTFLGLNSGNFSLTGAGNTGIGNQALNGLTNGIRNTGVGASALSDVTSGDNNAAVGHSALTNLTTGNDNVAIGRNAMQVASTASTNTAVGLSAGGSVTSGGTNVLIGSNSGLSLTIGSNNVGVGSSSLLSILTGAQNIAIGTSAGSNYAGAENSNIVIGNTGTAAESDTIRIGTQGTQTRAFCAGITGVTVPGTEENVVIDSATGQLGVSQSTGAAGSNEFFATWNTFVGYIDGAGVRNEYFIGTSASGTTGTPIMQVIFDPDSVFYPGDGLVGGTPASFTAPATGKYLITWKAVINSGIGTVAFTVYNNAASVFTDARSVGGFVTGTWQVFPVIIPALLSLSAGDVVTFSVYGNFTAIHNFKISGYGFGGGPNTFPPGTNAYISFIEGYRID